MVMTVLQSFENHHSKVASFFLVVELFLDDSVKQFSSFHTLYNKKCMKMKNNEKK